MITVDFETKVVQYCLDSGVGIEYSNICDGGIRCLTTDVEVSSKPYNIIRYVREDTVQWFLSENILPKTRYLIEQETSGRHIDMIDFDEWIALCNLFNCPEMSFDDALTINKTLWNYNITPIEILTKE